MSKPNHGSVDEPLRGGARPMPPNDPMREQALPNDQGPPRHPVNRPKFERHPAEPGAAVPADPNNPDGRGFNMSAVKTLIGVTPVYHVANADNLHVSIGQGPNRVAGTVKTVTISSGSNMIELTQGNVSDLLAMLSAFSASGMVS